MILNQLYRDRLEGHRPRSGVRWAAATITWVKGPLRSGSGQTPKSSQRANLVRFTPNRRVSGHSGSAASCHYRTHALQQMSLFNHLVGAGEKRVRHVEPERLCGPEVDHQPEFGRVLDWRWYPPLVSSHVERTITRGIAPAQRLPADNSAPRTADRLRQRLGRRMYAHRGRAAGIFPRCWKPSPEPSHPGRLIRRTYHAGCARCCAYLPSACSDCFSLTSVCLP
jgi:hypothetical protein